MVCDVIRVGGRLQHTDLPAEEKHPVILPSRHHVTNLIVQHYHGIVGHSGVQVVLSVVREKFWIIKGNAAVRHYVRERGSCRFWKSKASS